MNTLRLSAESKRPWWREPMVWLIAGLPLTAVVAGLTTAWIAAHNADSLISDGYVKQGFALVQQTQESDRMATRLGVSAQLRAEGHVLKVGIEHGHAPMPALMLQIGRAHV
jgi:hypothetical protein